MKIRSQNRCIFLHLFYAATLKGFRLYLPYIATFSKPFQNWPLDIFAVQEIGIKLCEDDVLLIASLVQHGQVGSIKHLDLVHKDFVCLDSRASDAFLSILTKNDTLLDTSCYGATRTSFSYRYVGEILNSFSRACESIFG